MPASPYTTGSVGPKVGPLRYRDSPGCMGIYSEGGGRFPIGIAYGVRWLLDERGQVATFRLVVAGADLPGLYVVENRRFVPADEWFPKPTDPIPEPRSPIRGTPPEDWSRCLAYRDAYGMATRRMEDARNDHTHRADSGRLLDKLRRHVAYELGGDEELRGAIEDGVAEAIEGREPSW